MNTTLENAVKTLVYINDINGNIVFHDTAKDQPSWFVINKELSDRTRGAQDGFETHPSGDQSQSYRGWVKTRVAAALKQPGAKQAVGARLPTAHPGHRPYDPAKFVADSIASRFPLHLQINARRDDAPAALRALADEVAADANALASKFTSSPVFPGALAAIRALQQKGPNLRLRYTLFTFGGDGPETWKAIASATGLQLDGVGQFKGHTLVLEDGRTFETPHELYALLQTGNFVLTADHAHWCNEPRRGKLIPLSGESDVLVHFADDNLRRAAAAVRITGDTATDVNADAAMATGELLEVDSLAFARDDAAFTKAINHAFAQHGWSERLDLPPALAAARAFERLTNRSRLGATDADQRRWGAAFVGFWDHATARLGVPFSPLMQALCDWAIDNQHASTLGWILAQIELPLTDPEDQDEQAPFKGNPLQRIAAGLASWGPRAAIPIWQALMNCIEHITDDPDDVAYSLKVVLRQLCYLQDAAGRAEMIERAREIISRNLADTPDLQAASLQRLAEVESAPCAQKSSGAKPQTALPPALSTLDSSDAIRIAVREIVDAQPANPSQRIELLCAPFIAALHLGDAGLVSELTVAFLEAFGEPVAQLRMLDRVSYFVASASPASRDAYVTTLLERLVNAPRPYWGGLLRALGVTMPEDTHASVSLARQLLPFIELPSGPSAFGQMEVWCALARRGHLGPLVEDKRIYESFTALQS